MSVLSRVLEKSSPMILDLLEERLRATPGKILFQQWYNEHLEEFSVREFYAEVERCVHLLRSLGVEPRDRLGLHVDTSVEWLIIDFAAQYIGAPVVPIYPNVHRTDLESILSERSVKICFSIHPEHLPKGVQVVDVSNKLEFRAQLRRFDNEVIKNPRLLEQWKEIIKKLDPQNLDIAWYLTSGTTGLPKTVRIQSQALLNTVNVSLQALQGYLKPERETLLTFLPLAHIMGRIESLLPFAMGWSTTFVSRDRGLETELVRVKPTVLFVVPRILEKILLKIEKAAELSNPMLRWLYLKTLHYGEKTFSRHFRGLRPKRKHKFAYRLFKKGVFSKIHLAFGGRLKLAICGGAPLPRHLGEYFYWIGLPVLEGYGLTETCGPVTLNTPEHNRIGTVGRPLPHVEIKIEPDAEILIRSPSLSPSAIEKPADWFATGDCGFIDPEGYLHVTDRKKDLIVTSGGKNIAPSKVESEARRICPWIEDIVVFGDQKRCLVAVISLRKEEVEKMAQSEHWLASQWSDLLKNPEVYRNVHSQLQELHKHLPEDEYIQAFFLAPHPFNVLTGEMTPSQKVKRGVIQRKYAKEILKLYKGLGNSLDDFAPRR